MANPLQLPFDFPPNTKPTTEQLQANFNALLQFVSDLDTAVVSLTNLVVGTLQTTSTAVIGGALTANSTAALNGAVTAASTVVATGAVTANNGVTVNNAALTANSTAALNGAVTAGSTVVATGAVTANNGVTVNNAALTANSTSALNGAVTAGSTVQATGLVTANNGVTVNNAALTANATSALVGAVTAGSTLGVTGDITATANMKLSDGSVNNPSLTFTNSTGMGLSRISANRIGVSTSGTKGWDLDSTGNITLPIQPAFLETMTSGTNKFGDGPAYTVVWDTEVLDRSNSFNLGTGIFTAPVAGVYAFVCFLDTSSVNVSPATPTVTIVTTGRSYYNNLPAYTTATCRGLSVAYTQMSAGDTAKVTIAGASLAGTKTAGIDFGYFAGFLFG